MPHAECTVGKRKQGQIDYRYVINVWTYLIYAPYQSSFLSLSFVNAPNERSHISVENLRKSLRESSTDRCPHVEPVIKESSTEVSVKDNR